jgi:hypothetical protein
MLCVRRYVECRYAVCRYALCPYALCRYAEWRGAVHVAVSRFQASQRFDLKHLGSML